jgi:uncharacterized protein HemX
MNATLSAAAEMSGDMSQSASAGKKSNKKKSKGGKGSMAAVFVVLIVALFSVFVVYHYNNKNNINDSKQSIGSGKTSQKRSNQITKNSLQQANKAIESLSFS